MPTMRPEIKGTRHVVSTGHNFASQAGVSDSRRWRQCDRRWGLRGHRPGGTAKRLSQRRRCRTNHCLYRANPGSGDHLRARLVAPQSRSRIFPAQPRRRNTVRAHAHCNPGRSRRLDYSVGALGNALFWRSCRCCDSFRARWLSDESLAPQHRRQSPRWLSSIS